MAESTNPLVEMRSISKRYGGVQALQDVDLDIFLGEVHALVGDNAAGKSTLVKTLAGAVLKDGGTITFDGRPVEIKEPKRLALRRSTRTSLSPTILMSRPTFFSVARRPGGVRSPGFSTIGEWRTRRASF